MKIDILGAEWDIDFVDVQDDPLLKECDGYCDPTIHRIVIGNPCDDWEIKNHAGYLKQVVRHEMIHAFMYESGLGQDWEHKQYGQEETVVDWFARQFPKLLKAFEAADAL